MPPAERGTRQARGVTMGLHGLASVTIGVPDLDATRAYYTDFGLTPGAQGWLRTTDGGDQLRLVSRPGRHPAQPVVRAAGRDDLGRAARARHPRRPSSAPPADHT